MEKYISEIISITGSIIIAILVKVIYNLKCYISIFTKELPKALEEAEKNFPNGHGDFKYNYVIDHLLNVCHKYAIHPNRKLFTKVINLFIELSKKLNLTKKIPVIFPVDENLNEIVEDKENEEINK